MTLLDPHATRLQNADRTDLPNNAYDHFSDRAKRGWEEERDDALRQADAERPSLFAVIRSFLTLHPRRTPQITPGE